jgi:hypothetical protein
VLVLTRRREILKQTSLSLSIDHGLIATGRYANSRRTWQHLAYANERGAPFAATSVRNMLAHRTYGVRKRRKTAARCVSDGAGRVATRRRKTLDSQRRFGSGAAGVFKRKARG